MFDYELQAFMDGSINKKFKNDILQRLRPNVKVMGAWKQKG